jgi:hypothetical protein
VSTTTVTYDAALARVRVAVSAIGSTTATVTVDRTTDGINYTTVRGAGALVKQADSTVAVDDYEFPDGVPVTYRSRGWTSAGALTATSTATITPSLAGLVWLKSAGRPFLNRVVTVVGVSTVAYPSRGSVFDVLGRRDPVAVAEVRGSRRFEITVRTETVAEADALETVLSYGDPMFLHVPATAPMPRSGHFHVGDVSAARAGRVRGPVRYWAIPLVEVEAPDQTIVGYTITWQGVVNMYATWQDVVNGNATWTALQERVAAPRDEIVG